MTKELISALSGAELDCWVAKASGLYPEMCNGECLMPLNHYLKYSPSTKPAQAWSIIERECISIRFDSENVWGAYKQVKGLFGNPYFMNGETGLIAAMRCYVASVYGDTVDAE